MRVNFNGGLAAPPKFLSLFELKPIQSRDNCDVYGLFALVTFDEGRIITVKFDEEDAGGTTRALNFGGTLIRESEEDGPPPNARLTNNGVIRAITAIPKGDEIILESSMSRTTTHPVDFLDRIILTKNYRGAFIRPFLCRVKAFVRSTDGSVSYTVQVGDTDVEETLDENEIVKRSLLYSNYVAPDTSACPDNLRSS